MKIKNFVRAATFSLIAMTIVGCARPTPYQRFDIFGRGGYQETRIANDTYEVVYYGNGATSTDTLNALLLYRSAEVTLDQTYQYFEVVKGKVRMPLSPMGGFRTAEHTIKMYKRENEPHGPNFYNAKKVVHDFKDSVSAQK